MPRRGRGRQRSANSRAGSEGWRERCGSSHGVTRLAALAGTAVVIVASSANAKRVFISRSHEPLLLTSALNLSRSLVALPHALDLLLCAKHLFVEAPTRARPVLSVAVARAKTQAQVA